MLQTINGFDLLLVLIIIALGYRAFNLNRECESYVRQIIQASWEIAELKEKLYPSQPDPRDDLCVYCVEIEQRITGDECICPPF
jgi:hypothetical protein